MLGDLPPDAQHIRGFLRKDVFVVAEEVNERAFLFGGEPGTNAYRFFLGAAGVYEDLLGALCRFKRPGDLFGVGRFFGDLFPEDCELSRGDDWCGVAAALDLALISALEGGADGDDPAGTRYLQLKVGIVGNGHELRVTWTPQDGVESSREPHYVEGEGLSPVIGLIPESYEQIDLP